ncbi:unnamed protein product [Pieris macdunnoughi]|uniref:Tc1-like transposase DDE domain-containing protein n=1 Tax=Pieris macdunnoughi TaxID=345717 RepID=A0A821TSD6_9NEOP|nr:unnamed protein product [Pieris macdunnoughi]
MCRQCNPLSTLSYLRTRGRCIIVTFISTLTPDWSLRDVTLLFTKSGHSQENQRKQTNKIYALDMLAYERGHEVIRLPPYYSQYNPIELIWAQVKGEVAAKNDTFNIADVEILK